MEKPMRRSASEVIKNLEDRIEQLEKQATTTESLGDYWSFLDALSVRLGLNKPLYMLGESLHEDDKKYFNDFLKKNKTNRKDELVKALRNYSHVVFREQDKLRDKIADMINIAQDQLEEAGYFDDRDDDF